MIKFRSRLLLISAISCGLMLPKAVLAQAKAQVKVQQPDPGKIQEQDPVAHLYNISTELFAKIKQYKASKNKSDWQAIEKLIKANIDVTEMSIWITGRSLWAKTEPKLQQEFSRELAQLVLTTYTSAIENYSEEQLKLRQVPAKQLAQERIEIDGKILGKDMVLNVNYRLKKQTDGSWKAYDIIVDGVSLLDGFRAQLSDLVRNQGVAAAIASMATKNVKL